MSASCWDCGRSFPSGRRALIQHRNLTSCAECRQCYDKFDSDSDRVAHEADEHSYCAECDRCFQDPNNARQHRNSKAHRSCAIACPLCGKQYTTATGVVMHIEAGACPRAQDMSRDNVYRLICKNDPQGVISKKLIGWTGGYEYEATEQTWNGDAYECYLCHREFGKLTSLNQHLNSPAHQQAYYHCPNASCRTNFKTLASFVNHLESESCGYMRFSDVQQRAAKMMRGGRLIGH